MFFFHVLSEGRNQILVSLCPQVFGMYVVKLAVAMVLAGGVQRIDPSGTKVRGMYPCSKCGPISLTCLTNCNSIGVYVNI